MTHRSPLITLAVVTAYFIAMLIANFVVHPGAAVPRHSPPPAVSWTGPPTSGGQR